jgi:hypothetical protein
VTTIAKVWVGLAIGTLLLSAQGEPTGNSGRSTVGRAGFAGHQSDTGGTAFGLPGVSLTRFDTADLLFEAPDSAVTLTGVLDLEMTPENPAVQRFSVNAALRVDGTVVQSSYRLVPMFRVSRGVAGQAQFHFVFRLQPGAGRHRYDISATLESRDSSDFAVEPKGGMWFYKSFLVAQDDKSRREVAGSAEGTRSAP